MERIWILLTGLLMLFSQVKAGEEAFVVDLPVEPTPTVTMDTGRIAFLLPEKIIFHLTSYLPADRADRDTETEAAAVYDQWLCPRFGVV